MGTDEEWEMAAESASEDAIEKAWAFRSSSMRATARSTVRSWTSTWRILSEEHGSAVRSSWICRCRSASISPMSDPDGEKHRPVMIHRVIFGSHRAIHRYPDRALRRQIPALAGAGTGEAADGNREVSRLCAGRSPQKFEEAGLRAEADIRNEKIGYKLQ